LISNTKLAKTDISKLFESFDNFQQDVLTSNNIKGILDAEVDFSGVMDQNLSFNPKSVISAVDLKISKGELIGLQSFKEIAEYMKSDFVVRTVIDVDRFAKNMDHIYFDNIEQTIHVKKETLYIPKMAIKSSAMIMNISGKHSFNNYVDYRLDFRLSDLFKKKESEYGYIVDDGAGIRIWMRMKGPLDNPEFEIDRESKRGNRKEYNKKEVNNMKSILKDEFGLFKKDTTVKDYKGDETHEDKFIIEWDEYEKGDQKDEQSDGSGANRKKKNNKKTFNKFLDKLGVKEDQEEKAEFEIEDN